MKVWVTAEGKPLKTEEDERTLGWEVKAEITDLSYSFGTVGRMTRVHSTNLPTTTSKKPWLEWTSCGTSDWWEEFLADLLGSLLLFLWAPHPTLGLAFFQQPASDSLFFFFGEIPSRAFWSPSACKNPREKQVLWHIHPLEAAPSQWLLVDTVRLNPHTRVPLQDQGTPSCPPQLISFILYPCLASLTPL